MDISRAHRTKQRIKYLAHKTFTKGVLSEIGGFGGLFAVDKKKYRDPVLVSSVDGVGTKLKIAFEMKLHQTVGADLVNHCVNDIAVQGATPLFWSTTVSTTSPCRARHRYFSWIIWLPGSSIRRWLNKWSKESPTRANITAAH